MPIQLDNMAQAYGINSQGAPIISTVSGLINKKVVFFDLETQKLAQEVGGWRNVCRMQLSIGVAHTEDRGFTTFTEETVSDLINLLKNADLVVGFNHMRFDYEVLRAYTDEKACGPYLIWTF